MNIHEPHLVLVRGGNLMWYFDCILQDEGTVQTTWQGQKKVTRPLLHEKRIFYLAEWSS